MVTPFERNSYEVSYYRLNTNLAANAEDVLSRLQLKDKDVFLYMNYFGVQAFSDEILQFIRGCFPDLIMLEDKTHDIFSTCCNKFVPDFMVCSIRKWLALPDGGVLCSKAGNGDLDRMEDTFFSDIRTEALKNKSEYLKDGNPQLKELFRSQFAAANEYLDKDKAVVGISSE